MSSGSALTNERAVASERSISDKTLADLLERPEVRTAKNVEGAQHIVLKDGDSPNDYDLTNPNLHYGTRTDVKASVDLPGPLNARPAVNVDDPLIDIPAGKSFAGSVTPPVGDIGPMAISDRSADEGQALSFDGQLLAPSAANAPTSQSSPPDGHTAEIPTGAVSGARTFNDQDDNNPITVPATVAQGKTVSESVALTVGDTGPTRTALA